MASLAEPYTIDKLLKYVGDTVRLRPSDSRPAHRAGRLLRIEGEKCVIKPWHHHKEETVDPSEIVPFIGRSTLDHTEPATSKQFLWVNADALQPRYYVGKGEWTGNPADAKAYPTQAEAQYEGARLKGTTTYPTPLTVAVERYGATLPVEPEVREVIREVLVEVPGETREVKVEGQTPIAQLQNLLEELKNARGEQDDAQELLDAAKLKCQHLEEEARRMRNVFDSIFLTSQMRPSDEASRRRANRSGFPNQLRMVMEVGKDYSAEQAAELMIRSGRIKETNTPPEKALTNCRQALNTRNDFFDRVGHSRFRLRPDARP